MRVVVKTNARTDAISSERYSLSAASFRSQQLRYIVSNTAVQRLVAASQEAKVCSALYAATIQWYRTNEYKRLV